MKSLEQFINEYKVIDDTKFNQKQKDFFNALIDLYYEHARKLEGSEYTVPVVTHFAQEVRGADGNEIRKLK